MALQTHLLYYMLNLKIVQNQYLCFSLYSKSKNVFCVSSFSDTIFPGLVTHSFYFDKLLFLFWFYQYLIFCCFCLLYYFYSTFICTFLVCFMDKEIKQKYLSWKSSILVVDGFFSSIALLLSSRTSYSVTYWLLFHFYLQYVPWQENIFLLSALDSLKTKYLFF